MMKKKSFLQTVFMLCLTAMLLTPLSLSADDVRGDINHDGNLDVADVKLLIDRILTGNWYDDPQTFTVNGVSFRMICVNGGTFTMGDLFSTGQQWEYPTHRVTLSTYWIGETEVTQELWQAVMGSNPSHFSTDVTKPVEMVSWDDCQTFIARLNELTGKQFRLPTEAEWEFAASGGIERQRTLYSGSSNANDVAWHQGNANGYTHPVAKLAPNELGIFDMSGNVHEWCQDYWGNYSSSAQTNPKGPSSGTYRIARGGGYCHDEYYSRVSSRGSDFPTAKYDYVGLRIAM